ncbi:hypothetical protein HDU93_000716 [Gonapodya sp. JEL0774]|nr:hypothetical protein HDU93_000716 [Gonapodya sp. JEL0774]
MPDPRPSSRNHNRRKTSNVPAQLPQNLGYEHSHSLSGSFTEPINSLPSTPNRRRDRSQPPPTGMIDRSNHGSDSTLYSPDLRGRSTSSGSSDSSSSAARRARKSSRGPPPDLQLISAVESRDPVAVRRALDLGANANARKVCTLACEVHAGSKIVGKGFLGTKPDDYGQEKGTGAVEHLTSMAAGESALAVAILRDSIDSVRHLLAAGANPNVPIEWRIIRGRQVWTKQTWSKVVESGEWDLSYHFANHLELALGVGTGTDHLGSFPLDYLAGATPTDPAQVWCTPLGAALVLSDPGPKDSTYESVAFVPNIEIVEALVAGGAKVTQEAREAVQKCLNDPRRLKTLEVAEERRRINGGELSPNARSHRQRPSNGSFGSGQVSLPRSLDGAYGQPQQSPYPSTPASDWSGRTVVDPQASLQVQNQQYLSPNPHQHQQQSHRRYESWGGSVTSLESPRSTTSSGPGSPYQAGSMGRTSNTGAGGGAGNYERPDIPVIMGMRNMSLGL